MQKDIWKDALFPSEVRYDKNIYTNSYGKFSIYPFEKNVGVTIANSLRRVLLSSIPGYAITSVKIDGVNHEFEPIKGVKEDYTDVILALKKVRVKLVDGSDKKIVRVFKKGKGEFLARDIAIDPTVEVYNPDLKIATLNEDADLSIDLQIELGKGYRSAEELMDSNSVISVIPIDAIFSPVLRVNYFIEDYRVGEKTDCEKVILEIWTNGGLSPMDALTIAARILKRYFSIFAGIEPEEEEGTGDMAVATTRDDILSRSIAELELSVRASNCLKAANISTIGQLLEYSKQDLLNIKNFGRKSLNEISEKLKMYGLTLKEGENYEEIVAKEDEEENIEEGE
ncbi:MAG: DNA-directed RNA polymerase subunit alpha [Brevinematia bacterium]